MAKASGKSKVSAERARLFKLMVANPISGLTPARLVNYLNAWKRGEIKPAALLFQDILERDDQAKPCSSKRTRSVAGLDWEILPIDDSETARKHKAALEHFYNNLIARDGLNEMERGGVRQLFRQMLTAVGMRYAVHEIIWQPGAPGGLTAEFKFLPLQFFENTTGKLRFLESDLQQYGKDLDEYFGPGGWMCTAGEGLMVATAIAYMFKTPAGLKAWVTYMEKFGVPGLHGKTSAAKDSPEWNDLTDALTGFGEDLALVTNEGVTIEPIETKSAGEAPHPPLVERMDRAISRIWMGGDLATMSATSPGSVGSQPQSDDLEQLKKDDAEMVTDALQYYVDRQVIRQLFGDVAPLAYFQLTPPVRIDAERELKIDDFLIKNGVPRGKKDLLEKYNRPEPDEGDELATPPRTPSPFGALNEAVPNAKAQIFRNQALATLSRAQAAALRPLTARIEEIIGIEDEAAQDAALLKLQGDLPRLLGPISGDPQLLAAWENIMATALTSGAAEAASKTAK